ncbi:FAD-dependent oxidoreductase [Pseudonocardia ailaonensis]|uniref:FAD-dependent oxidoreductase n=1 Tax=Pseudonocardia ailaonensis TaxID=367279 RepID=A0ABN2N4V4_9PSEU
MATDGPACVVVGASAAGVATAIELRANGFTGPVTLVDADPRLPYERPPLSKGLLGAAATNGTDDLVPIRPPQTYVDLDIELRLGEQVLELDPVRRRVRTTAGELPADHVVLATGVSARKLDVPGADAANVLYLRNAADARALADQLAHGGPLVIIGAGFIGLEMAAVAREHDISVTVVEAALHPLARVLGGEAAQLMIDLHRNRGVEFLLGATVSRLEHLPGVEGPSGTVGAVCLAGGRRIPTATVVVGVGVEPNVELARAAGAIVDEHGIVVDGYGRTSDPWIFATGDVASQPHPELVAPGRIEHWDVALRHGAAVGATIAGNPTRFVDPPYAWSDQYGGTLQLIGRGRPSDELVLRRDAEPGRFLAFWVRDGAVGAVAAMGMAREIGAVRRLVIDRVPVAAEDLASPELDLRSVLRAHQKRAKARPVGQEMAG